ncbi:MAG: hypothetical protein Q4D98_03075 [Planctomycetia bacterium]|nr:hypothetical protein [Planctomycetia bacterium]
MTFITLYSRKILSTRQKVLLITAVSVCVAALTYTYLAAEFITNALLVSISDTTAHVRLFIPQDRTDEIPEILAQIKQMPGVLRADRGCYVEKEFLVTTRKIQVELDKPGEVFFSGTKKICLVGYPFDSEMYVPPVLMENVYSESNRERMLQRPEDEPIRIITDPRETEQANWVIVNKNLTSIFPLGPACFGDTLELTHVDTDGKSQKMELVTAGYLMDSPLLISASGYDGNQIFTKITLLERFTSPEDRIDIIDLSLRERTRADKVEEQFSSLFSLEKTESWIDRNKTSIPFLHGLKVTACIGASAIVILSILGIFIVIMMLVVDKTRALAIVYALGLKAVHLRYIFLLIGVRVGIYALLIGGGGAFVAGYLSLGYWKTIVENFCLVSNASLKYSPTVVTIFALGIFSLCCIAAWLPTRSLVTQDPVQNLKNE